MKPSTPRLGSGACPDKEPFLTAELTAGQHGLSTLLVYNPTSAQGKHTCPCQQGSHLYPLRANSPLFIQDVFPQHLGDPAEMLLPPSTKGCFPSWQEAESESSGVAFQRV